ncbi:MAG TPA: hypothetical protein VFP64_06500 [Pyrinomonadaceae bacterium]|nr:hypothetical protein [Pyrinomonadaceae bacterium]
MKSSETMLMKSHKFASAYFAVMLFLLVADCSAGSSAMMGTLQNASVTKVVDEKTARTFDCRNANEYRFVVVENPNRKNDSDPVIPKDVNIVVGDQVISKIELPKESEAKNFSLNSIEKTKAGFEIKVDWGGGLNHYETQFNFRCTKNSFYLYRIKKVSFSTTNPDSGNFLDKKESKVTKIEPNLPIEKFVMTAYL